MTIKDPLERTINLHLNWSVRGNNDHRAMYLPQVVTNLELYLKKKHNEQKDSVREAITSMVMTLSTISPKTSAVDINSILNEYLMDNAHEWFSPQYFDDIMWCQHSTDILRAKAVLKDALKGHAMANTNPRGQLMMEKSFTIILEIVMRIADYYKIYEFMSKDSELMPNYSAGV